MITIRKGEKGDVAELLRLIKSLAHYEKAAHEVVVTEEELMRDGFGEKPHFWFYVAEKNHKIVGIALCYIRYSTWKGKGLYLEDFVVDEPYRGQGIGKMLFDKILEEAKAMKVRGMYWQVLDWNEPALNFYRKYKATLDGEWINGKLMF